MSNSIGCYSTITTATCVANPSTKLLDYILTNELVLEVTPSVIDFQISDRCLTFAMLRNSHHTMLKKPFKKPKHYRFVASAILNYTNYAKILKKG